MRNNYDPSNWYWFVAGDQTRVWSSSRAEYVPVNDAAYVAWLALGLTATAIDSEASLQAVLAEQYPAGWPPTPQQQSAADLAAKLAAGITITSASTPAVNGVYALDSVSTAQIFQIGLFAAQFDVFPSGSTTQAYPDSSGTPHTFPVAVFVAFLRAVAPLVSALETQAGIEAQGGTPSWPAQTAAIA